MLRLMGDTTLESEIMGEVVDLDRLVQMRETWRSEGKTVVLTNGCFDLLHVGHVRCIREAATLGDILIVALNGDASVRNNKGPGRPLQSERHRAQVIAALRGVDYVCFFDDPTADPLLKKLKPDVHAKGTDYTESNVPERQTVLSYGGRIAITGDPKDHSTRDIISTVRSRYRSEKPLER